MDPSSSSISRSATPTSRSSSTSISISTESSSNSDGGTETTVDTPSGSFRAGVKTKSSKSAAAKDPATKGAPALQSNNRHPVDRSSCPQPVRALVQGAGLLLGAGGLVSMIYAGIKLTPPDNPGVDAARAQHMVLMVSGAVEMAIAYVVYAAAARREQPAAVPVNPV